MCHNAQSYRKSFDHSHSTNNNKNKNKKATPKKNSKQGVVQFMIEVYKAENEKRIFSVFHCDSSKTAAEKLVKNFKLDQDLVDYFTFYIEE
jgi:hypothetical protein